MIKKAYKELEIEVVMFGKKDVIAASTATEIPKPTADDDDTIIVGGGIL